MQSTNQKIKNAILNSFLDKNTFEQNDEYAAKLIANTKDETMYNRILMKFNIVNLLHLRWLLLRVVFLIL